MEKTLNKLLSDLVVFYHKLQSYHWYVKGSCFFTVHPKLEEYYDKINEYVDEVAEIILQLDKKPLSTLKDFLSTTSIKEGVKDFVSEKEVYTSLIKDYTYLLNEVKDVKVKADKSNEYLVSATMDDYIAEFSKTIWMLKQSL